MKRTDLTPITIRVSEKFRNQLHEYAYKKGEFLYETAERLLKKGLQLEKETQNAKNV